MSNLRMKHFFARIHWRRLLILSLCFALLAGTTLSASAFDLTKVRNKSFEKDKKKDGIPNAWTSVSLNAKSKRVCNKSKHKKCSFKMVADGNPQQLYQVIPDSSSCCVIIATVSGWMKGKDLDGGGGSQISITFQQTDGGTQICSNVLAGGTFKWTKVEMSCVALEPFNSMAIVVYTNEDSGKVWFDKVKLTAVAP